MDEERNIYWRKGKQVLEGTQVKVQGAWLRRPDFELIRICKDPEEAEKMVKELNRYKQEA